MLHFIILWWGCLKIWKHSRGGGLGGIPKSLKGPPHPFPTSFSVCISLPRPTPSAETRNNPPQHKSTAEACFILYHCTIPCWWQALSRVNVPLPCSVQHPIQLDWKQDNTLFQRDESGLKKECLLEARTPPTFTCDKWLLNCLKCLFIWDSNGTKKCEAYTKGNHGSLRNCCSSPAIKTLLYTHASISGNC